MYTTHTSAALLQKCEAVQNDYIKKGLLKLTLNKITKH